MNVTLEKLYKRTKTGKIQSWLISVEKILSTEEVQIITLQGQLDGKKQRYVENIAEGKQNRSIYDQAIAEAVSSWRKKKDDGYISIEDLKIPTTILEDCQLEYILEQYLPKFNTDAKGNVKPMLAQAVKEDWSNVKFPCYLQPKLDGVRCLCIVNDVDDITFLSRSGKEYTTLDHIKEDISNYVEELKDLGSFEPFIFDGEIYAHGDIMSFQDIVSAVKKNNDNTKFLSYRVYDIVNENNQEERVLEVKDHIKNILSVHISTVKTYEVADKEEVQSLFSVYIELGYEGVMLRMKNSIYEQGFRSKNLLKYKEFDATEFEFIGFEYGARGVEDLIAVCKSSEGAILTQFKAKVSGGLKYKEELYSAELGLIGLPLTIKHFGITDSKLPRFPIAIAFRNYES